MIKQAPRILPGTGARQVEGSPVGQKVRPKAAKGNPLTAEQRRHAAWVVVMLNEALSDGSHSAWPILATVFAGSSGLVLKRDKVAMALAVVRIYIHDPNERDVSVRVSNALGMLAYVDPAFGDLAPERATRIAMRGVEAWNTLARLALACGALGCPCVTGDPDAKTVLKPTIKTWQNSRPRKPDTKSSG